MTSPYLTRAAERARKSSAPVKLEDETWSIGQGGEFHANTIFDGAGRIVAVVPDIPEHMTLGQLAVARDKVPTFYARPVAVLHALAAAPLMLKALKMVASFERDQVLGLDTSDLIDLIEETIAAAEGRK